MSGSVAVRPARGAGGDLLILAGLVGLGGLIALVCREMPSRVPVWLPYQFVWSEFLALTLAGIVYARGVWRMAAGERPSVARNVAYGVGVASIYAVLQTHFDYMAQHMFFLSRLQHLVLHHFGPFLIALAWPGAALYRGLPEAVRDRLDRPGVHRAIHRLQHPALAGVLFVGVIDLWLVPPINFRAMIDPTLYDVMSWSMVVDGLFFWLFILDPRHSPPARSSFGVRLAVVILVMFPQILVGSYLTFSATDLYPFYDVCGRLYASIGPLLDQHYGGLLVWIPASMMSAVAFLLTLNNLRAREEARPLEEMTEQERRMTELARGWTGR